MMMMIVDTVPKRQDRRERERPSCLALSSSKREFDLGRPRTQTTPLSVCFFFNSAQAPGDIMRRELDFLFYIFRECTYLHTYLMQKEK